KPWVGGSNPFGHIKMREPQAICLWLFSYLQHKFKVKGFQRYSSLDTQYLQQSPKVNGFVDGPV
ncbi:MAG: hypothetical protein UFE31_11910, partial [Lachnospiraceae bacterium]|nr:hypothetical protein [Lachnospiraceae bacterium]